MARSPQLRSYIQGLLRAEKARLNLTYEDLSLRLARMGIEQSPTNLSTKVARGDMSAQLFIALLKVLEVKSLSLEDVRV
jgi:hypothetical protein